MQGRLAACLLVVATAPLRTASTTYSCDVLGPKAKERAKQYCDAAGSASSKLDRAQGRKQLEAASGGNALMGILRASKTKDELEANAKKEYLSPAQIIPKVGSLVMFTICLASYFFCCWSACPCCKCCRCCKRRRDVGRCCKIVLQLFLLSTLVGVIVCGSIAKVGFDNALHGVQNTMCVGATLMSSVVNGVDNPDFLGTRQTIGIFDEMGNNFKDGSQFMTDLAGVIDQTKALDEALNLADFVVAMLAAMMNSTANIAPKSLAGLDLHYRCEICEKLASSITDVMAASSAGLGKTLAQTRDQVKQQLSGKNMEQLTATLDSGKAQLTGMEGKMCDGFGPMIDTDQSTTIQKYYNFGLAAVLLLIFLGILILLCGVSGACCWTFCEHSRAHTMGQVAYEKAGGGRRFNKAPHRCFCCTWCWACYYVMFTFLFGGILMAVAWPVSSACLVMEDVDGALLLEIGPALDSSGSSVDMQIMFADFVDQCFKNPGGNAKIADIIFTRNSSTQEKTTMRQTIVNGTKNAIDAAFAKVSGGNFVGSISIANSTPILQLRDQLSKNGMDQKISPDPKYAWRDDALYKEMASDFRGPENGVVYFWGPLNNLACDDFVYENHTVFGTTSFHNRMLPLGTEGVDDGSCTRLINCAGSAFPLVCEAANNFMKLKKKLNDPTLLTFDCITFDKDGATCDLSAMTETPAGSLKFVGDCKRADGSYQRMTYKCNLAQFTALVRSYDMMFKQVFTRLDTVTGGIQDNITTGLKGLVDRYVVSKIVEIADRLSCGFLALSYRGFLDGMCYGFVLGFVQCATSYVVSAIILFVTIIYMYIFWRIAVDNNNDNYSKHDVPLVSSAVMSHGDDVHINVLGRVETSPKEGRALDHFAELELEVQENQAREDEHADSTQFTKSTKGRKAPPRNQNSGGEIKPEHVNLGGGKAASKE